MNKFVRLRLNPQPPNHAYHTCISLKSCISHSIYSSSNRYNRFLVLDSRHPSTSRPLHSGLRPLSTRKVTSHPIKIGWIRGRKEIFHRPRKHHVFTLSTATKSASINKNTTSTSIKSIEIAAQIIIKRWPQFSTN